MGACFCPSTSNNELAGGRFINKSYTFIFRPFTFPFFGCGSPLPQLAPPAPIIRAPAFTNIVPQPQFDWPLLLSTQYLVTIRQQLNHGTLLSRPPAINSTFALQKYCTSPTVATHRNRCFTPTKLRTISWTDSIGVQSISY